MTDWTCNSCNTPNWSDKKQCRNVSCNKPRHSKKSSVSSRYIGYKDIHKIRASSTSDDFMCVPVGQDLYLSFAGKKQERVYCDTMAPPPPVVKPLFGKAKELGGKSWPNTTDRLPPKEPALFMDDPELQALLDTLPTGLRDGIANYLLDQENNNKIHETRLRIQKKAQSSNALVDTKDEKDDEDNDDQKEKFADAQNKLAHKMVELTFDTGRNPTLWFLNNDSIEANPPVKPADIRHCLDQLLQGGGGFSSDNRIGISGTLHRISALKNRRGDIVGMTYRVGKHLPGVCNIITDLISERGRSILLLGPPGVGKTTLLRDTCKTMAKGSKARRVLVIDTSNEIAGDGDVPHHCIGRARRMQVSDRSKQYETMIEAVQNHSPNVIVVDEIGTTSEVSSARTISQRGVSLVATAHGVSIQSLLKNPTLSPLVGGVQPVTLSDKEASARGNGTKGGFRKTILERKGAPTFTTLVELEGRSNWRIHADVKASVDAMLANESYIVERRWVNESGYFMARFERCEGFSARDDDDGDRLRVARSMKEAYGGDLSISRQTRKGSKTNSTAYTFSHTNGSGSGNGNGNGNGKSISNDNGNRSTVSDENRMHGNVDYAYDAYAGDGFGSNISGIRSIQNNYTTSATSTTNTHINSNINRGRGRTFRKKSRKRSVKRSVKKHNNKIRG